MLVTNGQPDLSLPLLQVANLFTSTECHLHSCRLNSHGEETPLREDPHCQPVYRLSRRSYTIADSSRKAERLPAVL